ncbi:MAG TPA: zinc-binding dehydrogenase [Ilumatobacteraceae bacterium]|nr:zinc-binding dehydrogenase [Ilumatobacteraceae bacterium]
MKAWRIHQFGEPADVLQLDDAPAPSAADLAGLTMGLGGWEPIAPGREPFDDWVLMQMTHAALALPDVTTARGTYPVPVNRPYIPGQEGVGLVIDASPGRAGMIGKTVAAVCMQPFGSLAEVAVGISMIFEIPDGMGSADAAGLLIAAHTGYHTAIRRGQVRAGETVAITGAAGGVGSAMIQLCVAHGARVIAIVGGQAKADFCRSLGAEVVDHHRCDPVEALISLLGGAQLNAILDPVQGPDAARLRLALAPDGRHVLCGHAGGLSAHQPDFYLRNHTLVGVTLGGYSRAEMVRINDETHQVITDLIADGRYRPTTSRQVSFDDVPAAITELAERRSIGRVVVQIDHENHPWVGQLSA